MAIVDDDVLGCRPGDVEEEGGCVVFAVVVGSVQDSYGGLYRGRGITWWFAFLEVSAMVHGEVIVCEVDVSRVREDELLYVLRKLLDLRLWTGTLWAAFSDAPSANSVSPPGLYSLSFRSLVSDTDILQAVDPSLPPSALVADVVRRSSVAHLFYFYPVLCEIASIPRKTPAAWVSVASPSVGGRDAGEKGVQGRIGVPEADGKVVEVDARALAKECLKVLGKEMGAA